MDISRLLQLWGKTGQTPQEYHPVLFHMIDVGHVAQILLSEMASPRWRNVINQVFAREDSIDGIPWLIAVHDIGKISLSFQFQVEEQEERLKSEGFPFGNWRQSLKMHHTLLGQVFIAYELSHIEDLSKFEDLKIVWREMVGGHHGKFVSALERKESYNKIKVYEPEEWRDLRQTACRYLKNHFLSLSQKELPEPTNLSAAAMALTGFTILCDFIGSDKRFFPASSSLGLSDYLPLSYQRAIESTQVSGFLNKVRSSSPTQFSNLFTHIPSPRPVQSCIDVIPQNILNTACLAVIEAPTGEGKTEVALALAHRLAQSSGTNEFYYALPTTATSNQMYHRIQAYLKDNLGLADQVKLVHGQAYLYLDDIKMEVLDGGDENDLNLSLEWFAPKKRSLLAPFGVGTVDQIELAALNVKHAALRMVGLAGKVIIIDEVHAYDVYMTTIIERLLNWVKDLGTSIILLSATLPQSRKESLVRAFGHDVQFLSNPAYPAVWVIGKNGQYFTEPSAHQPNRKVDIHHLHFSEEQTEKKVKFLLSQVEEGGCACWITNTVGRSQAMFQILTNLADYDIDIMLLHSRFPLRDRQVIEENLMSIYGPKSGNRPQRGIVIGTQILEQSLDLDFDVLITDQAPIDLLLQRAGRMHRHDRARPKHHAVPRLYIYSSLDQDGKPRLEIDKRIYAEYFLLKTWEQLKECKAIYLPEDYRSLIETVYSTDEPSKDSLLYQSWQQLQEKQRKAVGEAELRLLPIPQSESSVTGLTSSQFNEDENNAAWIVAQTRLGMESITVIPLEKKDGKEQCYGLEDTLDLDMCPTRQIQLEMLRSAITISHPLVIRALRENKAVIPEVFRKSSLLKGCFPLYMEQLEAKLQYNGSTIVLKLDPKLGLVIQKKE